ncbi:hypothetical protein JTB14_023576 [Gonioctena quinquepunctata]|nr:hypothetical protein JTB14_023576 [Gonioctena quinquepunctata]
MQQDSAILPLWQLEAISLLSRRMGIITDRPTTKFYLPKSLYQLRFILILLICDQREIIGVCFVFVKVKRLFDIQRKIYIANTVLEHFMTNTWRFMNEKTLNLHNQLSEGDKAVFGVELKHIEWDRAGVFEIFRNGVVGIWLYLLKEEFDFTRKIFRRNVWR